MWLGLAKSQRISGNPSFSSENDEKLSRIESRNDLPEELILATFYVVGKADPASHS